MWRIIMCVAMSAVLGLVNLGCEPGGGDKGGEEAAISGNSGLRIQNASGDDMTVYFDDEYIGKVSGHGERTWSVPSGSHRVRIDNAEHDLSKGWSATENFRDGETLNLVMSFD